jgi:hypothetical protein
MHNQRAVQVVVTAVKISRLRLHPTRGTLPGLPRHRTRKTVRVAIPDENVLKLPNPARTKELVPAVWNPTVRIAHGGRRDI